MPIIYKNHGTHYQHDFDFGCEGPVHDLRDNIWDICVMNYNEMYIRSKPNCPPEIEFSLNKSNNVAPKFGGVAFIHLGVRYEFVLSDVPYRYIFCLILPEEESVVKYTLRQVTILLRGDWEEKVRKEWSYLTLMNSSEGSAGLAC